MVVVVIGCSIIANNVTVWTWLMVQHKSGQCYSMGVFSVPNMRVFLKAIIFFLKIASVPDHWFGLTYFKTLLY